MAKEYTKVDGLGSKTYYKDPAMTIRHREDGPAIEHYRGTKVWYANDVRHRLDGPAIENAEDVKSWFVNGVFIFDVDTRGNIQARIR